MENKVNFKATRSKFYKSTPYTVRRMKLKKWSRIQKNGIAILSYKFWWLNFAYIEPKCVSRSRFRSFVNH